MRVYYTLFVLHIDGSAVRLYHHQMTVEPIYKSIGAIIRGKRRGREWPQQMLAARLGISRATLANIETGRQRVLAHQLYAFAEALDTKSALAVNRRLEGPVFFFERSQAATEGADRAPDRASPDGKFQRNG